jgi:hypothetical protein
MPHIACEFIFIALVPVVTGCGSSGRVAVSGVVTVNGQPLEGGDIAFTPVSPDRGPSGGAAITHGTYRIPAEQGLLPSQYNVQIHAFRGTGKKTWDGMGEPNAPASQKHFVEEMEQYIPSKYNDATELAATIVVGKTNRLDFDLQIAADRKSK